MVATGVTKPDGKVVYGFGRTDPNATYGGDDIFSNDGTDVFHVVGGIDLSGYQKVLVTYPVTEEILKSNLKKILAVEGSTQLDATTFSSDSIEIMFEPPVDGRARFMATTPSRFGNTFFMRVKVR